ncbi:MAG: PAS domain-containing protein [Deltaproteobacteria bacterium]|nr:PAS domain-containing protein [Deltaproteobacteria bacterium]
MSNGSIAITEDLALEVLHQIPTPVMAVDKDMRVILMNTAACQLLHTPLEKLQGRYCYELFNSKHCNTPDCRMKVAMSQLAAQTARNEVTLDGRTMPIEYTAAPLLNAGGELIGGLEYIIDITEQVRYEEKLQEQSRTILEISTPAIKLWDRIIVLPVVGVIDSVRAMQMMEAILNKIMQTSSRVIILDIQGVLAVDTAVANHLIKITRATKLMGCRCIISGISPAVSQTLVQLGIDLGDVVTNSTLQDALADAFNMLNLEVISKK